MTEPDWDAASGMFFLILLACLVAFCGAFIVHLLVELVNLGWAGWDWFAEEIGR